MPSAYVLNMIDKITTEELEVYHLMDRYTLMYGKLQWNMGFISFVGFFVSRLSACFFAGYDQNIEKEHNQIRRVWRK